MKFCERCGKRIYQSDLYYEINETPVCIDCALDYLDEECKESDEEGEYYVVDDMSYELDETSAILNDCLARNYEDEDDDPRSEPEYWDKDR